MAGTDPGTRSPGHIFWRYTHAGKPRTMSCRLVNSADLVDLTAIRAAAFGFASDIAVCLPNTVVIPSWGIKGNDGHSEIEESFISPIAGTVGVAVGLDDFFSTTLTIEGRGGATTIGGASGRALIRFHVGGTLQPLQGKKLYTLSELGLGYVTLLSNLNDNTVFFADYYGQKADAIGSLPYQFNAHTQRKDGT